MSIYINTHTHIYRQGLSQAELEEMLHIHERGLGEQWKDLAEALHADIKV